MNFVPEAISELESKIFELPDKTFPLVEPSVVIVVTGADLSTVYSLVFTPSAFPVLSTE